MGALLSQFMNKYAYTDFHELNADWLIKTLMEMINQVENFVSLNAIKYADPIQWNIVRQYEKNTVVIDPLSGTAYISVQPVPMGVTLTNTDYWTVVFDLGSFVVRAAKNFSNRYEADTTTTATFPSSVGDWVVWGDTLYEVISNIVAGDQYTVDSNIRHITMEEVAETLAQAIQNVQGNVDALDTKVGDLADLNTSDQTSIVNAINEVGQNEVVISNFTDLSNMPLRVDMAVFIENVGGKFTITDVEPLSDLYYSLNNGNFAVYMPDNYVDFLAFNPPHGTDATTELNKALAYAASKKLPLVIDGRFEISSQITISNDMQIIGRNNAILDFALHTTAEPSIVIDASTNKDFVVMENIIIEGNDTALIAYPTNEFSTAYGIEIGAHHIVFKNVEVKNFDRGITLGNHAYCIYMSDCQIRYNNVGLYTDCSNLTDSGGLMVLTRCSIASNRLGVYNVFNNFVFESCNLDYNKTINICRMTSGGITVGYEIYNNSQIEDGNTADDTRFSDITNQGSGRIFNNCLFFSSVTNDGYFDLESKSSLSLKNCFLRFGGHNDVIEPNKRVIKSSVQNVIVDSVRVVWYPSVNAFFKLCDSENVLPTKAKGFALTDVSATYSDNDLTLENTSSTQGTAVKIVPIDRHMNWLVGVVRVTSNYTNNANFFVLDLLNDNDEQVAHFAQSISLTAGTPLDYKFQVQNTVGATKARLTLKTNKAGTIDGVTPASILFEDLYAYYIA